MLHNKFSKNYIKQDICDGYDSYSYSSSYQSKDISPESKNNNESNFSITFVLKNLDDLVKQLEISKTIIKS